MSGVRSIFIGTNGIRAGWRFLIYVAIFFGLAWAIQLAGERWWHLHRPTGPIDPGFAVVADLLILVPMLVAAYVMSRIERVPMGSYGLPLRTKIWRKALLGAAIGLLSLSVVLGVMLAAGVVHFTATAFSVSLVYAGVEYLVAFLTVGLAEEFLFRGYAQHVLAQGIGFWPAAALLSLGFAASHIGNPGENAFGITQVAIYGLVFCYVLKVTGNLWFAVGYHMAWDWSESFLFGVPDSGHLPSISALHGAFAGPEWLTGGSAGPEGSVLATLALLALVPAVTFLSRIKGTPDGAAPQAFV